MASAVLLALGRCRSWARPSLLQSALLIVLYLGAGTVFYRNFDEKDCESDEQLRAAGYNADTCKESWTVVDALYFSIVTMSTVGYGHLTPSNDESKVFTVFYILFGITVVWVRVLTMLTHLIENMRVYWAQGVDTVSTGTEHMLRGAATADTLTARTTSRKMQGEYVFWIKGLGFTMTCLVATQFVFAGVFSSCESEISFGDAFYHCMVTATTVGYGDISLTRQESRVWASLHIIFSVTGLAVLIANVDEVRMRRKLELKRIEILNKPLDEERIRQLDKGNGQGIDKCEFVVGTLMMLGAEFGGRPLEWGDVQPLIQRFEAMDKDSDHVLTVDDIVSSMKASEKSLGSGCNPRAVAPERELS